MRRVAASGWLMTLLLAQTNLPLCIETPATVYDLPAGVPQFIQTAQGYVAALVSGQVVQENGKATGARPGKGGARH